MRGALNGHHALHVCRGIIPAYAGSTRLAHRWRCRRTDHPRVCGEHLHECQRTGLDPGSSPRMRGAHLHINTRKYGAGIIPAYAGSTWSCRDHTGPAWDHPRVCGEHLATKAQDEKRDGSSPRMRGARGRVFSSKFRLGIIPAYAGSTLNHHPDSQTVWDHPRVCGEHPWVVCGKAFLLGSSPRMRGALYRRLHGSQHSRIIPAYAGSTGES